MSMVGTGCECGHDWWEVHAGLRSSITQQPLHVIWWQPNEPPECGSHKALQRYTPARPAYPWQIKLGVSESVICTTVHLFMSYDYEADTLHAAKAGVRRD